MRVFVLAGAAACSFCLSGTQAAYIVNFAQVGNNVIAAGSGTLNPTGLIFLGTGSAGTGVLPSQGVLGIGPTTASADYYGGVQGPAAFGPGGCGGNRGGTASATELTSGSFLWAASAAADLVRRASAPFRMGSRRGSLCGVST